jgi:hypothetical protein
MLFGDALAWCEASGATWTFEAVGGRFVLRMQVEFDAEIVVTSHHPNDWGWMFIEAVERAAAAIRETVPPDPPPA